MSDPRINVHEWIRRVRSREVECLNSLPSDEREEKYALHLKVFQKHSAVFQIVMPEKKSKVK